MEDRPLKLRLEDAARSGELLYANTTAGPSIRIAAPHSILIEIQNGLEERGIQVSLRRSPSNGNVEMLQITGDSNLRAFNRFLPEFNFTALPTSLPVSRLPDTAQQLQATIPFNTEFQPTAFILTGEIVTNSLAKYLNVKEACIRDFAALSAQRPDFHPKIRFNDDERRVEVGYAYEEFAALVRTVENGSMRQLLPHGYKNPYNSDMTAAIGGPSVEPLLGQLLQKAGEARSFGYNTEHPEFDNAMRANLAGAGRNPSAYSLSPPPINGSHAIEHLAFEAGREGKPARIVVGESHLAAVARGLVIQAIPGMAQSGAALCLEHFFYETQQQMIDKWISDPNPNAPMPLELEAYVRKLDVNENHLFEDILLTAKQHGVRIICIDTEACRGGETVSTASGHDIGHGRIPGFNYIASQIIAKEVGQHASFVALVGNLHCARLTNLSNGQTGPGLDTLCNAYSLAVREVSGMQPRCTVQGWVDDRGVRLSPNLLLEVDQPHIPALVAIFAQREQREKQQATTRDDIPVMAVTDATVTTQRLQAIPPVVIRESGQGLGDIVIGTSRDTLDIDTWGRIGNAFLQTGNAARLQAITDQPNAPELRTMYGLQVPSERAAELSAVLGTLQSNYQVQGLPAPECRPSEELARRAGGNAVPPPPSGGISTSAAAKPPDDRPPGPHQQRGHGGMGPPG